MNKVKSLFIIALIFISLVSFAQDKDSTGSVAKIDTSNYIIGDINFNLLIASEAGYKEEVIRLLKLGANPNAKTWQEITPLMYASERGYNDIVKILVEAGAEINFSPDSGLSALLAATTFNELDVVETLLRSGANVNIKDSEGRTALMLAIANEFYVMTDMLLYYDANVNHKDNHGNTPAIIACYNGDYEIVKLLDNYGANFDLSDNKGYTPLMVASQKGYLNIVEYLTEYDPLRVNAQAKSGETPLLLAVTNKHVEVTKFLLEQGANPNKSLNSSENNLSIARKYSNDTIKKVLLEYGAKPNYMPSFYKIGFGAELNFNITDFMMDFFLSLEDSKYNAAIFLGYGFRPFENRVLIENQNGLTYQAWERRRNIYFGVNKKFIISNSYYERHGFGLYANCVYTSGKYNGLILKPEKKFIVVPRLTYFHDLYFNRFEAGLEYLPLNVEGIGNVRVVCTYTLNINFKKNTVKSKQLQWIEN